MARTTVDIDDDLVRAAMRKYGLRTKGEAVELALRRLVGPPVSRERLLDLEGLGWDGDLAALHGGPVDDQARSEQ